MVSISITGKHIEINPRVRWTLYCDQEITIKQTPASKGLQDLFTSVKVSVYNSTMRKRTLFEMTKQMWKLFEFMHVFTFWVKLTQNFRRPSSVAASKTILQLRVCQSSSAVMRKTNGHFFLLMATQLHFQVRTRWVWLTFILIHFENYILYLLNSFFCCLPKLFDHKYLYHIWSCVYFLVCKLLFAFLNIKTKKYVNKPFFGGQLNKMYFWELKCFTVACLVV